MKNIKAVIFDLDNTLIDRKRAFTEMLYRKLPSFLPKERHSEVDAMVQDILKWDNNGTLSRLEAFSNYVQKYNITSITAQELDQSWSNESGTTVYLYDDVISTLEALKPYYKLAILSNGNAISQRRKLKSIDLYDYLDYSLVSGEFSVNKPDPLIFQHVAKELGLSVDECLYVGDNYAVDILGSRSAGMKSVFVNRFNETHDDTLSINNIQDLLSILI